MLVHEKILTYFEGLQARAREAEGRSRKILEEEKAKDAAWRQAVKMVSSQPIIFRATVM